MQLLKWYSHVFEKNKVKQHCSEYGLKRNVFQATNAVEAPALLT